MSEHRGSWRRLAVSAAGVAAFALAAPAGAQTPEQVYEPGPERGRWLLEYNGQAGGNRSVERPHSFEMFAGLSDRLAVGVEVEGERDDDGFTFDEVTAEALIMLTKRDVPVEVALLAQVGTTFDGNFPQLGARLIASHASDRWNAAANLIVRRERGEQDGSETAYVVTAHRRVSEQVGLGIEASGSIGRLGGFDEGYERRHFAGPSATFEIELGDKRSFELGGKYLRRIAGQGARDTARFSAKLEF
jgi:hypothetical protein